MLFRILSSQNIKKIFKIGFLFLFGNFSLKKIIIIVLKKKHRKNLINRGTVSVRVLAKTDGTLKFSNLRWV